MKKIRISFTLFAAFILPLSLGAADPEKRDPKKVFGDRNGCFLVKELESGRVVREYNPKQCRERFYPCSTFKIPIALMGFDSGVLHGPDQKFKWDGKPKSRKTWEQDHTTRSWMRESVVWVSLELTPKIGQPAIDEYLRDFQYGNRDFSGGITRAWLASTLAISAEEQVALLRRMKLGQLDVEDDAVRQTLNILPVAYEEGDVRIVGKTGSCATSHDETYQGPPYRLGWYVGYLTRGKTQYAFATVFTDSIAKRGVGGFEARDISVELLKDLR